jgi:hypothetical protein
LPFLFVFGQIKNKYRLKGGFKMRTKLFRRSRKKSLLYSILGLIVSGVLSYLTYYLDKKKGTFEPFKLYVSNKVLRRNRNTIEKF